MEITGLLSVNTIAFEVLGYPMSYIEFVGTIFYLWSVWLISRRKILTWPIGIISVILYMILFYQIQLYADTFEQAYYLVISVYGWWYWNKEKKKDDGICVRTSSSNSIIKWAIATLIVSIIIGFVISKLNIIFPQIFPQPASYPYLDSLTTIMSFTAMFLMARKRIESWVYWIIVDVIGIGVYYVKDVKFISLLYVILLVMAINGLREWLKTGRNPQ